MRHSSLNKSTSSNNKLSSAKINQILNIIKFLAPIVMMILKKRSENKNIKK